MALFKKKPKNTFYDLTEILKLDARYNIIFGMRSNGKTYAVLKYALERYVKGEGQLALVRRWDIDIKGMKASQYFNSLCYNGEGKNVVEELTGGKYNNVYYYSGRYYLSKYDEKTKETIKDENPFCYTFALSTMEHDKGSSYPEITTVLFDEFISRDYYLPDEFVYFMNVLSTIIRQRDNVKIFMCGNTVNKYNPYFEEMGLRHAKLMKAGDIEEYTTVKGLKIAVNYSDAPSEGRPSDIYFSFDNPKLQMITGGEWELDIYPHNPIRKVKPSEVLYNYFIEFDHELLQCEIILKENNYYTYIHKKTTPLKDEDSDLIFSNKTDPRPNWRRKLTRPHDEIGKKIYDFFKKEKVFYQNNEIGEMVSNYLKWCETAR